MQREAKANIMYPKAKTNCSTMEHNPMTSIAPQIFPQVENDVSAVELYDIYFHYIPVMFLNMQDCGGFVVLQLRTAFPPQRCMEVYGERRRGL